MTVAELIQKLQKLPQELPIGSFQTHDQGYNEGNEYSWTFTEFSKRDFKTISIAPTDEGDVEYFPGVGMDKSTTYKAVVVREGL